MAKNEVFKQGKWLALVAPVGTLSGDPFVDGQIPAVAQADRETAGPFTGKCSADTGGVYNLSVKGIDGGGNSAVAEGDIIYYVIGDTPKLSKKATGVRFGYALGAVTSGATATIPVKVGY